MRTNNTFLGEAERTREDNLDRNQEAAPMPPTGIFGNRPAQLEPAHSSLLSRILHGRTTGRLAMAALFVTIVSVMFTVNVETAEASDAPVKTGVIKIDGGSLSYQVMRRGQGIRYKVQLTDTKKDGRSIYVEVKMNMAYATDPNVKIANRNGYRRTVSTTRNLAPTKVLGKRPGTRFQSVEFKLCVSNSRFRKDPCKKSGRLRLSGQVGHNWKSRPAAVWFIQTSMANFQYWKARRPAQWGKFDWTDDKNEGKATACSAPLQKVTKVVSRIFEQACERHDFGYRNFGKVGGMQLAPRDDWRRWIDNNFWRDMGDACNRAPISILTPKQCQNARSTFYGAVRNFGGRPFYGR